MNSLDQSKKTTNSKDNLYVKDIDLGQLKWDKNNKDSILGQGGFGVVYKAIINIII